MPKVTKRGLERRLGEGVRVEREGKKGNRVNKDGTIDEGEALGILEKDSEGFYVKMYKSSWRRDGAVYDPYSFMENVWRIEDRDFIALKVKNSYTRYLVRINKK